MITIDYQNTSPLYEQIVEKFQMLILGGALLPGSQMPSVRSLAMDLSINPNTIQKAFSILEQQGYIYSVKGKGNFVTDSTALLRQKQQSCLKELKALLWKAREIGISEQDCLSLVEHIFKEGSHDRT